MERIEIFTEMLRYGSSDILEGLLLKIRDKFIEHNRELPPQFPKLPRLAEIEDYWFEL